MTLNFSARVIGGTLGGFALGSLLVTIALGQRLHHLLLDRVDGDLKVAALDGTDLLSKLPSEHLGSQDLGTLSRLAYARGAARSFIQVFDADGNLAGQSDLEAWPDVAAWGARLQDDEPPNPEGRMFHFTTRRTGEHPAGIRLLYLNQRGYGVVRAGWDLTETSQLQTSARNWLAGSWLALVAIGSCLGWLAARSPLRGIQRVIHAADKLAEKPSSAATVPANTGVAETDRLAAAFNHMAERIDTLLNSMQRMTDNIAHDIRTPVARMRTKAEHFLHQDVVPEVQAQIIEDCDHILHLVGTLLDISRAEAGLPAAQQENVDLTMLVTEAGELFEPVFEQNGQHFQIEAAASISVQAERHTLQRILSNLLDNAAKYTRPGDSIRLTLEQTDGQAVISVSDTGPGIPAARQPHLFDRFFRGDASRSQPGLGLGLAFCNAAAIAAGGSLSVISEAGNGACFQLKLPLANSGSKPASQS